VDHVGVDGKKILEQILGR